MTRPRPSNEEGVALLFVLIIVTVTAVFVGAVLSYAQTGIKGTKSTRVQAAAAYAADGAMQVALNGLRKDAFSGVANQCQTTGSSWLLPNIAPGGSGIAASSAFISCTPDATNTVSGSATSANSSPGNAILTLGTGTGGEDGISVSSNAGPLNIRGGIFSNSTINVSKGGINNSLVSPPPYTIARGACTGSITPTPTCNYAAVDTRGSDPGTLSPHGGSYDAPTASSANGVIGTCLGGQPFQALTPGRFTSATALTATTGCTTGIVAFAPGTYYFDFTNSGSHVWNVSKTYVIAGTPTIPLTTTPSVASMTTACVDPTSAAASLTSGVTFVFGGDSQLSVTGSGNPGGQITICASKTVSGPPIAVYGLKSSVSLPSLVTAQSGCVTALPPATRCPVIMTDQSPNTTLTLQGLTYVPSAWIDLNLNNNTNQIFRWGLVARALSVGTTGSADLSGTFIDVPNVAASVIPADNIMYLTAHICTAASTCTTSGKLRLRAKVRITGATPRTVNVLSWSVIR